MAGSTTANVGKPWPPARRSEFVSEGQACVATDGPDAMRGLVERVIEHQSGGIARVRWSNGHVGRHRLTVLRRAP